MGNSYRFGHHDFRDNTNNHLFTFKYKGTLYNIPIVENISISEMNVHMLHIN